MASFVPWQGQSSHAVRCVGYSRASCDSHLARSFAAGFILYAIYLSLLVQLGNKCLNSSKVLRSLALAQTFIRDV